MVYSLIKKEYDQSELGQFRRVLPLSILSKKIDTIHNPKGLGRPSYLDTEGELSVLFLKHKTGLSDKALLASLNTNLHFQLFCGWVILPKCLIRGKKLRY